MECLCSVLSVKPFSSYYPACPRCIRKLLVSSTTGEVHHQQCTSINQRRCCRGYTRFFCRKCSFHFALKEIKWNYCVAMVISDGSTVSEVVVFGPQLNSLFGKPALQLHRFLQVEFDAEEMSLPHEHPTISKYLSHSLRAVFTNRTFLFRFRASSTGSLAVGGRTSLNEILKVSGWSQRLVSNDNLVTSLVATHIVPFTPTATPMATPTVIDILNHLLRGKENVSPSIDKAMKPHPISNRTRDDSFYNHMYGTSGDHTSSSICPTPFDFDSICSSVASVAISNHPTTNLNASERELRGVDLSTSLVIANSDPSVSHGNHSNQGEKGLDSLMLPSTPPLMHVNDGSYSNSQFFQPEQPVNVLESDNLVQNAGSWPDCENDLMMLPSQLQRDLVRELMTGADSPPYSPAGPLDNSLADCELVVRELREEWLLTQNGSHVSIPIPKATCYTQSSSSTNRFQTDSFDSLFWGHVPSTQEYLTEGDNEGCGFSKTGHSHATDTAIRSDLPSLGHSNSSSLDLFQSMSMIESSLHTANSGSPNGTSSSTATTPSSCSSLVTPKLQRSLDKRRLLLDLPRPPIGDLPQFATPGATSTPVVMATVQSRKNDDGWNSHREVNSFNTVGVQLANNDSCTSPEIL